MTARFLVVGEPVERALPYNRHHDFDVFCVDKMPTQDVVGLLDGADARTFSPRPECSDTPCPERRLVAFLIDVGYG